MTLFDELQSLTKTLVKIQEELPEQHARNVLGIAAYHLEKYAASLPPADGK